MNEFTSALEKSMTCSVKPDPKTKGKGEEANEETVE